MAERSGGNEIVSDPRTLDSGAMGVLDEILSVKRDEVTVLHRPQTQDLLRKTALAAPPPRDFAGALRREDGTLAVIAEIKRRSPSKGELAPDLDAPVTAKDYERGGASAISVLTDRPFFGGTVEDLQAVSGGVALPVLRKDFTIDPVQVYETRAIGADAILLILAALPDDVIVTRPPGPRVVARTRGAGRGALGGGGRPGSRARRPDPRRQRPQPLDVRRAPRSGSGPLDPRPRRR